VTTPESRPAMDKNVTSEPRHYTAEDFAAGNVNHPEDIQPGDVLAATLARVQAERDATVARCETLERERDARDHEYGTMAASVEQAYAAMGAKSRDEDPDARDPFYIGEAVAKAIPFPIQPRRSGSAPHPMEISWHIAELAFSVYAARYGTQQSLKTLAKRGGFDAAEMDMFLPDWRERCDAVAAVTKERDSLRQRLAASEGAGTGLRARNAQLEAHLVESVQAMAAYQRRNPERNLDRCDDDAPAPIEPGAM
jgi:hypothetical protein